MSSERSPLEGIEGAILVRTGFAFVLFAAGARGQFYVVDIDPNPHDFDDLQVALDTAPAGSVLHTPNYFYAADPVSGEAIPFRVTKSVTIDGDPQPDSGDSQIVTTLVIDAPGADVLLQNLLLGGYYECPTGDAVEIRAARSVVIKDCIVRAGPRKDGFLGAGIRVTGSVDFIGVYDSRIRGCSAGVVGPVTVNVAEGEEWTAAPSGGPGLDLPDDLIGLATVSGSEIYGGAGGWLHYIDDPAMDDGPAGPLLGGAGGPGLLGACETNSSIFIGGAGGTVEWEDFGGTWDTDADGDGCLDLHTDVCGIVGDSGKDVDGAAVTRLRGVPLLWIARGRSSSVSAMTAPSTLALVLIAFDPVGPFDLRGFDGHLQVLPPWLPIVTLSTDTGLGFGWASIIGDIPDDPVLDGVRVYVQVADTTMLSMLGTGVIRP